MKKIRTDYAGGMPFELDDLEWLFNSIYSAFGALGDGLAGNHADPSLAGLAGRFVILRGGALTYTGSTVTGTMAWSNGWALYNGELREIKGGSVTVTWASITGLIWSTVNTESGTETYQDASVRDTYRDETLTVIAATSAFVTGSVPLAWNGVLPPSLGGAQTMFTVADRMSEAVYAKLKNHLVAKALPWTPVTPGTNWGATGLGNNLSWRINLDGTVQVAGYIGYLSHPTAISGASALIATGLPKLLDFASPSLIRYPQPVNSIRDLLGTTIVPVNVYVTVDGELWYSGPTASDAVTVLPINFNYPYNPLI